MPTVPLKSADDRSRRLTLLDELSRSTLIDARQRNWLDEEQQRLRKGIEGEREAAYFLDQYFRDSEHHVVLHDLRFEVDGHAAQIDHLVIARGFTFYLFETKCFGGNLVINERGEFTAVYGRQRYGIPSPIEQSRRHERLLVTLLGQLGIEGRTQKSPDFAHVVMLHPKAVITRPDDRAFDTRDVIKADQFPSWHQHHVDSQRVGSVLGKAANLRSLATIESWGRMLIDRHRPADPLALPDFMAPRQHTAATPPPPPAQATDAGRETDPSDSPAKRLVCARCHAKISFAEGRFCWSKPERFGGVQYCREHQTLFR